MINGALDPVVARLPPFHNRSVGWVFSEFKLLLKPLNKPLSAEKRGAMGCLERRLNEGEGFQVCHWLSPFRSDSHSN
jgi:hypothetical protein